MMDELTSDIMASINRKSLIWISFVKNMFQKSTNLNWKPFVSLDLINPRPNAKHICKTRDSHLIDLIKIWKSQHIWADINCFSTNNLVTQLGKPYSGYFFRVFNLIFIRVQPDFSNLFLRCCLNRFLERLPN